MSPVVLGDDVEPPPPATLLALDCANRAASSARERGLIGLLRRQNLLAQGVLPLQVLLVLLAERRLVCQQLQKQRVGLGALLHQGRLHGFQFFADGRLLVQLPAQCLLLRRHRLGLLPEGAEHRLVGLGHLVDHVDAAEQILKAAGAEEHRPVGDVPIFLHGAQALAVGLLQRLLLLLRRLQVALALGDEEAYALELRLGVLNLRLGVVNGLVDGGLLLDGGSGLLGVGVQLRLERRTVGGDVRRLLLERLELGVELGGGLALGCSAEPHKGQQSHQDHNGNDSNFHAAYTPFPC